MGEPPNFTRLKMKVLRNVLSIVALFATVYCQAGDSTSGGGDYIRFIFQDGQEQAIQILNNVNTGALPEDAPAEVKGWLKTNAKQLGQDLKNSKLIWEENSLEETCARTKYESAAPVRLSFRKCYGNVLNKYDAGKLLIHEASHHLGVKDEQFADQVAKIIYKAWETQQLVELTLCEEKRPITKYLPGKWVVDTTLTIQMPGRKDKMPDASDVEFTQDLSVLKTFKVRKGDCVYDAGHLTSSGQKGKFGPVQYVLHHDEKGHMFMSYFWQLNGHRRDERNIVFLATSRQPNDGGPILFVGGDSDNEPVTVLRKAN